MSVGIKKLPVLERPRERLKNLGPTSLSNEELLAIILKTGTKNSSAKSLAAKILIAVNGIENLENISYQKLIEIKGIGNAKALAIIAIVELSKRINKKIHSIKENKFTSADIVFKYYEKKLENKKQEHFYCLYLDNKKTIIQEKLLFIGTLDCSLVHPREVFKEAYLVSASTIICIHNHPSGSTNPSLNDIQLTKRLVEVGNLLGIQIIDHIIIGKEKYYSFHENGLIA